VLTRFQAVGLLAHESEDSAVYVAVCPELVDSVAFLEHERVQHAEEVDFPEPTQILLNLVLTRHGNGPGRAAHEIE
jgi:hypothetical protein